MQAMDVTMPVTVPVSQAGFWRRTLALAIDATTVSAGLAAIGLALFNLTGGQFRISEMPLINHSICFGVSVSADDLRLPADFTPDQAQACVRQVFGYTHDRTLEVSEVKQAGAATTGRSISFPLDAQGRVAQAFYLDGLSTLLLAAYLLLCEWLTGTTIGKRIMGVRVRPLHGGHLSFAAAAKRTAIRFAPVIPLVPPAIILSLDTGPVERFVTWNQYWTIFTGLEIAAGVITVAILANFITAIFEEDLPWHDRWAGTEAVTDR
ncbi:MAG: RDD family protein [Xanthobacteraceae bacterium]